MPTPLPASATGEADALVVAKLGRLSRSVLDFAAITEWAKRKGWAVVTLDVDVDTSTPTGELVANITSSVGLSGSAASSPPVPARPCRR